MLTEEAAKILYSKDDAKVRLNVDVIFFHADKVPDYATYRSLMADMSSLRQVNLFSAIVHNEYGHNLITDFGLNWIGGLINGVSTPFIQFNGVGSGTNTPASTDTDLQTAIGSRKAVTSGGAYVIANVCHIDTFYGSADNNGTWNETIISHSSTGANASARYKFASPFTKDTTKSAVVAWSLTLTNA